MTKTEATKINTMKRKKSVFSGITAHIKVVLPVFMYVEMLCQVFYRAWVTFL